MRFKNRIIGWKHSLLRLCSKSYRNHDAQMARMHDLRVEAANAVNAASKAEKESAELRKECEEMHDRLKLAVTAQESASQQVIVERALRQAADERAERYHSELKEAQERTIDWFARGLYHRRPVHGDVEESRESSTERGDPKPKPLPEKPMARTIARQRNRDVHTSLQATLAQMRGQRMATPEDEIQVGPEFTN